MMNFWKSPLGKVREEKRKAHQDMQDKLDESQKKLDLILERLKSLTKDIPAAPKKLKAVK